MCVGDISTVQSHCQRKQKQRKKKYRWLKTGAPITNLSLFDGGPKPLRTVYVLQTGGEREHVCCHGVSHGRLLLQSLHSPPVSPLVSHPWPLWYTKAPLVTILVLKTPEVSPSGHLSAFLYHLLGMWWGWEVSEIITRYKSLKTVSWRSHTEKAGHTGFWGRLSQPLSLTLAKKIQAAHCPGARTLFSFTVLSMRKNPKTPLKGENTR